MSIVDFDNIKKAVKGFNQNKPFPHAIIDNFFDVIVARQLADEFPNVHSELFNGNYFNQLEIKRTGNIWDRFPPITYKVFTYLNSPEFLNLLEDEFECDKLYPDQGLHGGGWHTHPPGGLLNVHLDYSIHPKLGLQRKYNLIVYINPNYQKNWGGELGLWDSKDGKPSELVHSIEPIFNRAVIFETTSGWHGLEVPNKFPKGESRNSLAVYYLIKPEENIEFRQRALFAPSKLQENDQLVLELIDRRSKITGNDPTKWSRE